MQQVESVTQTVARALADGDRSPREFRAYFHDEQRLRILVASRDHILYRAERDVVQPRLGVALGVATDWRIDRVTYPAADLPTGELNRSTGHWNPTDQWEIFQVDQGEVVLVVRMPGPSRPTELLRCGPGSLVTLVPGSWHLTYVWRGPAVVTNAYSVSRDHDGHTAKYFTRPTLRCGLRRDGTEIVVFRDEGDPAQDAGAPVFRAVPERNVLPPLESIFTTGRLGLLEDLCADGVGVARDGGRERQGAALERPA